MDESGDLWFDNELSSKFFIVTFLFASNNKIVDKIIKKIFTWLSKQSIKIWWWILHSKKEKQVTRNRLLKMCVDHKLATMTIYLDKSKIFTDIKEEKHVLYNFIVNVLLDRIINKNLIEDDKDIKFIASRRETSKILNQNFVEFMKTSTKKYNININCQIATCHQYKWLQIVDFLSRAIYQKYENNIIDSYNIIKEIIIEEKWLYE